MENLLGILSKIGFDWQVALANLVNFLILLWILKKYAFGPVGKLLKERQEKINQGILDAEKNQTLLVESQKNYEEIIVSARKEANDLIQSAKKEANLKREELLEDARGEVSRMLENGKKSLEVEKNKMVAEAKKEIINLVTQSLEKVLDEKPDDGFNQKMINQLKEVN